MVFITDLSRSLAIYASYIFITVACIERCAIIHDCVYLFHNFYLYQLPFLSSLILSSLNLSCIVSFSHCLLFLTLSVYLLLPNILARLHWLLPVDAARMATSLFWYPAPFALTLLFPSLYGQRNLNGYLHFGLIDCPFSYFWHSFKCAK